VVGNEDLGAKATARKAREKWGTRQKFQKIGVTPGPDLLDKNFLEKIHNFLASVEISRNLTFAN
jgi:hypothetical protein